MPAVQPGSLILVTGASGFVASYIVNELLARGFRVRGTVRTAAKGDALKASLGDNFEYVIVEDIATEGAFKDAIKGVDGVVHNASPQATHVKSSVWNDMINPAIAGTKQALQSSSSEKSVQRLVITSSYAAISNSSKEAGTVFTEDDWNTPAVGQSKEQEDKVPVFVAYRASKLLSEKAAWDYIETSKPQFDLVTLVPSFATGPIRDTVTAPTELDASNKQLFGYLTGAAAQTAEAAAKGPIIPVVDVRDIAHGHVEALLRPEASNQRIILNDDQHVWQEFLDAIPESYRLKFPNATWGTKGAKVDAKFNNASAEKSKNLLGFEKYRGIQEQVVGSVESILAKAEKYGWKL